MKSTEDKPHHCYFHHLECQAFLTWQRASVPGASACLLSSPELGLRPAQRPLACITELAWFSFLSLSHLATEAQGP